MESYLCLKQNNQNQNNQNHKKKKEKKKERANHTTNNDFETLSLIYQGDTTGGFSQAHREQDIACYGECSNQMHHAAGSQHLGCSSQKYCLTVNKNKNKTTIFQQTPEKWKEASQEEYLTAHERTVT